MNKGNYEEQLLRRCVEIYEKRKYYAKQEGEKKTAIFVRVQDIFLTYRSPFELKRYRDIHRAIVGLIQQGILSGVPDEHGYFDKLRFMDEKIDLCYERLGKKPVREMYGQICQLLERYDRADFPFLHTFCDVMLELLHTQHKLPYGLDQDAEKLEDILRAMTVIEGLEEEMTIQAFSEEVYGDPEWFWKIAPCFQNIVFDFLKPLVEKERVLELLHLVEEPTYMHVKGPALLNATGLLANVSKVKEGIAISTRSIKEIKEFSIYGTRLIVTHEEKAFHDVKDEDCVVIYLGGVPTQERVELLRLIYEQNPEVSFAFRGDIDVYGFLTYEFLCSETEIPFQVCDMDVETLKKYKRLGKCVGMSVSEKRLLDLERLDRHREVLHYMDEHNCKWEWRRA